MLANAVMACAFTACGASRTDQRNDPRADEKPSAEIVANAGGDVEAIRQLWASYLKSQALSYGCQTSVYWTQAEQRLITMTNGVEVPRCFDLTLSAIWPREQKHDVMAIDRVSGSKSPEYRITARFRTDSTPSAPKARTTIVTVYAIQEAGEWKLSGALPRATASWRKETVGPFTYHLSPGQDFSRARADSAVRFADSLATAFDVPRLKHVDYYTVESGDAMMQLYGVQLDTLYRTAGGQSLPGMIVSGDPVFREYHGHEIAHTVLFPIYYGKMQHIVASEGVVTWLGGTRSLRYPAVLRALGQYLADNPTATLDTVIAANVRPMHNHGAALLSAMVYERAGVPGIKQFYDTGYAMQEFRTRVAAIMGMTWEQIGADWKRRALVAR